MQVQQRARRFWLTCSTARRGRKGRASKAVTAVGEHLPTLLTACPQEVCMEHTASPSRSGTPVLLRQHTPNHYSELTPKPSCCCSFQPPTLCISASFETRML